MPQIDGDLIEYALWARSIRGLADNTVRVRLDLLYRLSTFLGFPLRDAQVGHLLRFERLAIAGRSPQTRRAYASHLRAFYRWLLQQGVITEDPSVMLTVPKVPRGLPRPIDEDDLGMALQIARPKMRAMLTLAAYAGLRAVEISGLNWDDLVREQDGSCVVMVRNGKGNKSRTVEVGQTVVRALQAYGMQRRGPVFLGADGRRIDARSVSSACNRFLRRHGIDATLHQLRHRYGVIGYQLTRDLRLMQEQLGHSSPATTQIYTRPSSLAAKGLVRALDELPMTRPAGPFPPRTGRALTHACPPRGARP